MARNTPYFSIGGDTLDLGLIEFNLGLFNALSPCYQHISLKPLLIWKKIDYLKTLLALEISQIYLDLEA